MKKMSYQELLENFNKLNQDYLENRDKANYYKGKYEGLFEYFAGRNVEVNNHNK